MLLRQKLTRFPPPYLKEETSSRIKISNSLRLQRFFSLSPFLILPPLPLPYYSKKSPFLYRFPSPFLPSFRPYQFSVIHQQGTAHHGYFAPGQQSSKFARIMHIQVVNGFQTILSSSQQLNAICLSITRKRLLQRKRTGAKSISVGRTWTRLQASKSMSYLHADLRQWIHIHLDHRHYLTCHVPRIGQIPPTRRPRGLHAKTSSFTVHAMNSTILRSIAVLMIHPTIQRTMFPSPVR